MIKRIAGAVALVALSLLAAAGLHRCEREPARPVVRGARVQFGVLPDGGREAPQWLDVTTPQGADLMPALVREVDAVCGPYPMGSGPSLTLHHALPIPHPTDGTRWALPVDTCARQAIVAYVAAHCAGKSNAACARAKNWGSFAASLDATWQATRPTLAAPDGPPDALDGGAL